jgi:hypothetical protein
MTLEEFNSLKPMKNPHGDHGWNSTLWETHGAEFNFVRNQNEVHVWTLVESDEGLKIITGLHHVNRIGYFVTEEPWAKECEINT